jgi:drug/metabolite transporter (DMT)-like permease
MTQTDSSVRSTASTLPEPRSRRGLAAADLGMLVVCLIWGLNFGVTKLALADIPPLPFTAIRFVGSSVLLWIILRIVEQPTALPAGGLKKLIILGVVGNTFYQLAFTLGLARTTATNSALILSTVPTVVAVFAGVTGLERITPMMRWGIALGTVGVVLVIATRGVGFETGTLTGDLLTVLGVLCWAGYTLGLRSVPAGVSPLRVTTITTLAGTPGLVLAGVPGMARLDWGAVRPSAWWALAYASVFSLVIAYLLWNRSVKAVGGTRTAIYMCVTPLVAAGGAWLLLGERPHPLQGIGAIFIIAGVLLTRTGGSKA